MRFHEPFRLRRSLAEIGKVLGLDSAKPIGDPSTDLGALYLSSSHYADAIGEFRRALDDEEHPATDQERKELREKLAWCYFWTGGFGEAEEVLADLGAESRTRPGSVLLEGRIALERGDPRVARERAGAALSLAQGRNEITWIGPACSLLGIVAQREGRSDEARECFEEALLTYRVVGDSEGECRAYVHLGTLAKSECRWDEALRYLDKARRKADDEGFYYLYGSASLNTGNLSYRLGYYEEAAVASREALRVFREIGYSLGTARALLALARLSLERDQEEEFRRHVGEAVRLCRQGGYRREAVLIEGLEGEHAARRGLLEEADIRFTEALRMARTISSTGELAVSATLQLADLCIQRKRISDGERLALDVTGALAAVGDPALEGWQRRILAEAAVASEAWQRAEEEVSEAIDYFERIGYRRDLAKTLVVAAEVASCRGADVSTTEAVLTHLFRAKQIWTAIGDLREVGKVNIAIGRQWIRIHDAERARASLLAAREAFREAGDGEGFAEAAILLQGEECAVVAPRVEKSWPEPLRRIVTGDPKMEEILRIAERVSAYPITVLIEGETGTGKQLLARAIHEMSPRVEEPFVTVNCASLPENILESELFGYMQGAFTGALTDRKGLFEEADGGTIFLDEIGKAGPHVQRSLLHVLDEGMIRPVGSTSRREVDVRVICATSNADLPRDMNEGLFLKDLFYRINDITLRLPALRERGEDVRLLTDFFLDVSCRRMDRRRVLVAEEVRRRFQAYRWPGNVRELEKMILRALVLASGDRMEVDHLPEEIRFGIGPDAPEKSGTLRGEVEELERRRVSQALHECGWNRSRAARRLGLSLRGLRNKIKRYDLERE